MAPIFQVFQVCNIVISSIYCYLKVFLPRKQKKKMNIPYRATLCRAKFSSVETIRRAKFSSPNEKFVTFARRKISPNKVKVSLVEVQVNPRR